MPRYNMPSVQDAPVTVQIAWVRSFLLLPCCVAYTRGLWIVCLLQLLLMARMTKAPHNFWTSAALLTYVLHERRYIGAVHQAWHCSTSADQK